MAADEAQLITDAHERLTRELNFAYDQSGDHQDAEARASLAHAAGTLNSPEADKLTWQIRIAGWVSISELSRAIDDKPAAETACDQAVASLRRLEPETDRPQFAVGVADEVKALNGPAASAKFLRETAVWTAGIAEVPLRRQALKAIAGAIFQCDDFSGGLTALRIEHDPTWRSDTLESLAGCGKFTPITVTQNSVSENAPVV